MAPKAMKRKRHQSPMASGRGKKKARVVKTPALAVRGISKALATADHLSSSAAKTLAMSAGPCMLAFKDERHAYQASMVEMIGEALSAMEAALLTGINEQQAKVDGADAAKAAREAAVASAESSVQELESGTGEAQTALTAAAERLAASEKAVKLAENGQASIDNAIATATKKKENLESALNRHLLPLRDGAVTNFCRKSYCSRLVKVGSDYGFEKSMLAAFRLAVMTSAASRGPFDDLAMAQFEARCNKFVGELSTTIEEAVTLKAERDAAVEATKTAANAAREAKEQSNSARKEANKALAKGQQALQAAKDFLKHFISDMRKICNSVTRRRQR
jgi:hypothetical protein